MKINRHSKEAEIMKIKIEDAQLTELKDTDEYKELQSKCYAAARKGEPVDLSDLPAPEYKYFNELYLIYRAFTVQGLTEEDAKKKERAAYADYCQNERDKMMYIANIGFWQTNIRKASTNLSELLKAGDRDKALELALDIIEKLLNNTVVKKTVYSKVK